MLPVFFAIKRIGKPQRRQEAVDLEAYAVVKGDAPVFQGCVSQLADRRVRLLEKLQRAVMKK